MLNPSLSIITINYNNAEGLAKTISSVATQDFFSVEYIVIDGASDDGSDKVIESNKVNLDQYLIEKDKGVYHAMNKGIEMSKGDYLLFLNSGDFLVSPKVISSAFSYGMDADIVYGDLRRTFRDGSEDEVQMPEKITLQFMMDAALPHPSSFIKKSVFDELGNYDESYRVIADHTLFLKAFLVGRRFKHIPVCISNFEMTGLSAKVGSFNIIKNERSRAISENVPMWATEMLQSIRDQDSRLSRIESFLAKFRIRGIAKFFRFPLSIILKFWKSLIKSPLVFMMVGPKVETKSIPIIINNRNRLSYLKRLIDSLRIRGYSNIHIIDNDSTFPPLLEYYDSIGEECSIHFLKKNEGFCALWDTDVFDLNFRDKYYVYTDPDLEIHEDCPNDFIKKMLFELWRNPQLGKIGLGLVIDDLPDHYDKKDEVIEWEKQYFVSKISRDVFNAPVDTTFALYRPNKIGPAGFVKSARLAHPYVAKHLPWYENSANNTDENKYYIRNSATSTHWT